MANFLFQAGKENLNIKTLDFLNEINEFGISELIFTDINRDGTKIGPNFEETIKLANKSKCPLVISGGYLQLRYKKAKKLGNKKIEGIIIGKAIYDGDIKLDELAKKLNTKMVAKLSTIRRKIRNGEKLGFSERARAVNKGLLPSKTKKRKMLKNEIIPCLDVKNGRVVKGINFVD